MLFRSNLQFYLIISRSKLGRNRKENRDFGLAETIYFGQLALPAQWNLQTCIDYALQQNITIRKNRLNAESAEVDVKTAKAALFPSLTASVSQRIVNRPNSQTNTIIDGDNITSSQSKTSYNGSYGIDANWTLYNGSKRLNTLKQQRMNISGE